MATIRIRLGEEDRERLGAPEWVGYDTARMRLGHVRALKQQAGMTPQQLADRLSEDDYEALAAFVWLALLESGADVPFAELDFNFGDLDLKADAEGKPTAPTGAKKTTRPRTRR